MSDLLETYLQDLAVKDLPEETKGYINEKLNNLHTDNSNCKPTSTLRRGNGQGRPPCTYKDKGSADERQRHTTTTD